MNEMISEPPQSTQTPVRDTSPVPGVSGQVSRQSRIKSWLLRNTMVVMLIIVFIVASISYSKFLEIGNLKLLLLQNSELGIIAVGVTMLMVAGAFDLSVVPVYVAGGCIYAAGADKLGWPVAMLLAVVAGVGAGAINGLVVGVLRVNSFIATLATASIFGGIVTTLVGTRYLQISSKSALWIANNDLLGIPAPIVVLILFLVVGQIVLGKTVFGRKLLSIGGNEEASRLAGLRITRLRASAYMVVGACAAFAGVIYAAQITSMTTGELTDQGGVLLDVIAIVVIGGTSLFGGEGAVWRTAIGLAIFGVLGNVFAGVNASNTTALIVQGLVILTAVSVDAYARTHNYSG